MVWVALALAVVANLTLAVFVLAGALVWRKVAPTVTPLVAMLAPPTSSRGSAAPLSPTEPGSSTSKGGT